jgi:hypothetical protein
VKITASSGSKPMLKIGQNVTVGYPDRDSVHKPGVIYNRTVDPARGNLYWVRVMEKNGVYHSGDTYLETDVRALESTPENPAPEHFSVGNDVVLDGEQWRIRGITGDGDEMKYEVYDYGMPVREVTWADFT